MADQRANLPAKFAPRELIKKMTPGQLVSLLIMLIAGLVLVAATFVFFTQEKKAPLYPRPMDAKTIVAIKEELQSRDVSFKVKDGKVFVPRSMVEDLRTEFEANDLAPDSQGGFSILEDTNPLKAGESMMKMKERLALQTEISRMLKQNSNIRNATVFIVPAKDSPFEDERKPAKASVALNVRDARKLGPEQVRAVQDQVAAAIDGATADDITVTDQDLNRLSSPPSEQDYIGVSQSNLQLKSNMERDLERKITSLVESFLGQDSVIAEVTLDVNFDQIESVTKSYGGPDAEGEPQKYYETTKNEVIQRDNANAGAVGAAPNTAQGAIDNAAQAGGSRTERDTSTNQYYIDETQTSTRAAPFTIERMSIGLNLDYQEKEVIEKEPGLFTRLIKTQPDWVTVQKAPLDQNTLTRVEEMVKGATNYIQGRDFISTNNFEFARPISLRAEEAMNTGQLLEYVRNWAPFLLQVLVFIVVAMILFSLFRRFVAPILQQAQLEEPALSAVLPSGTPKTVAELESELEQEIEQAIPSADLSKSEIMKKRIIEMTQQDPESISSLVRTWMVEDD